MEESEALKQEFKDKVRPGITEEVYVRGIEQATQPINEILEPLETMDFPEKPGWLKPNPLIYQGEFVSNNGHTLQVEIYDVT